MHEAIVHLLVAGEIQEVSMIAGRDTRDHSAALDEWKSAFDADNCYRSADR